MSEQQKTPEEMWEAFIAHLNKVDPLDRYTNLGHQSFLGSIASYRKIFLEANKPDGGVE